MAEDLEKGVYDELEEEPSFDVSPEEFEAFRREVFLGLYNLWRAVESQQEQIKTLVQKLEALPTGTPPAPQAALEPQKEENSVPMWVWILAAACWFLGFAVRGFLR